MAKKKDLEKRIAALEAEVAILRARPYISQIGPVPAAPLPGWPGQIWCGATTVEAAIKNAHVGSQ